jgi:hypothetical protein
MVRFLYRFQMNFCILPLPESQAALNHDERIEVTHRIYYRDAF